MWSFVENKGNKQWIGLAIDVLTFINCRSIYWQKRGTRVRGDYGIHVRAVDRQCAVSYTDFCPFLGHSFS